MNIPTEKEAQQAGIISGYCMLAVFTLNIFILMHVHHATNYQYKFLLIIGLVFNFMIGLFFVFVINASKEGLKEMDERNTDRK